MVQFESSPEKPHTGRKRPIMAIRFRSFIGIPIQILIFLLAFPHTELGAPVLQDVILVTFFFFFFFYLNILVIVCPKST